MGKFIDLTGQTFGRWTVIERAPNHGKKTYWKCKCNCGTIKEVCGSSLKNGQSQSCGCLSTEKLIERNKTREFKYKDISGQRFGKLIALQRIGANKHRMSIWECKCDCGNITNVTLNNLLTGHTQSCGCITKTRIRNINFKDLTGKKIGKLFILKETPERDSKGQIKWECKCDCGNIVIKSAAYLRDSLFPNCGCENSNGEALIKKILQDLKIPYIEQYSFNDCINPKTNYVLKFDFYLPNNNCCIEYDGIQHFQPTSFSHDDLKERQYRDDIKNQYCKNNNIKLIRIPYTDYNILNKEYILNKL